MRSETRTFYELVIHTAVEHVVASLDDALDLGELARGAALSPLHFHRIFRGVVGETPLALHRRLRLERAAWRLATGADSVTRVAFEAGYETHESFTRAFRDAYASSPTEFRARVRRQRTSYDGPPMVELAARCGVHFTESPQPALHITVTTNEEEFMDVEIISMPEQRIAAVSHRGPYSTIYEAFQRLDSIVRSSGLWERPDAAMIAIYHDDPESTPLPDLRADAGCVVPDDVALPDGVTELRIAAGSYARTTHIGPYNLLGDVWARLMGEWLPHSGHRIGKGETYERYLNTPMNAEPHELRTDLYVSLAE